jgi:hypothetical protein
VQGVSEPTTKAQDLDFIDSSMLQPRWRYSLIWSTDSCIWEESTGLDSVLGSLSGLGCIHTNRAFVEETGVVGFGNAANPSILPTVSLLEAIHLIGLSKSNNGYTMVT